MIRVVLAFLASAVSGCVSISDGMFLVKGDVSNYKDKECECRILSEGQENPSPYNIREISGKFSTDYTVAPGAASYTIEVKCGNELLVVKSIEYGQQIKAGDSVDLGKI